MIAGGGGGGGRELCLFHVVAKNELIPQNTASQAQTHAESLRGSSLFVSHCS